MSIKIIENNSSLFPSAFSQDSAFPAGSAGSLNPRQQQQLHLRRHFSSATALAPAAPAELSTKKQNPSFPLLLQCLSHTSAVAKSSFWCWKFTFAFIYTHAPFITLWQTQLLSSFPDDADGVKKLPATEEELGSCSCKKKKFGFLNWVQKTHAMDKNKIYVCIYKARSWCNLCSFLFESGQTDWDSQHISPGRFNSEWQSSAKHSHF